MQPANRPDDGNVMRGIWLMIVAMIWLPGLDAFAKLLGENGMTAGQITLFRFSLQICFLMPLIIWTGQWRPVSGTVWLQLARGVCMMLATFCFFSALRVMPLAETIAIFFVEPMLLTLLSVLLLGEVIHLRRIAAIIAGFIGALIVIQPNFLLVGWAVFWPLGTAFGFAMYMMLTRQLSGRVPVYQLQMSVGLVSAALAGLLTTLWGDEVPFLALRWPAGVEWSWIIGLAVIATSGHLLLVAATRHAPASLLAPFQYIEIVTASLLGFFIFGDIPAFSTWLGIAVIVGAGLYLAERERSLGKTERLARIRR